VRELLETIIQISKTCPKDSLRNLDRVAIDVHEGALRLRATDGHAFAQIFMPLPESLKTANFCVSLDDIKGIKTFLAQTKKMPIELLQYNEGISIIFSARMFELKIMFSKYSPEYPKTDSLMPGSRSEFVVGFNPILLLQLAESLGLKENASKLAVLRFEISKDKTELRLDTLSPIKVEVGQNVGVLMPMRINRK